MSRNIRNVIAGLVSVALFASVLVLALNADGREATAATSNDGGAWLVDRSRGGAAHVEFTTRQPTVSAQVADPGSAMSALQSPGIVLLHDRSASTVKVVDSANASQVSTTSVPVGAVVKPLPNGAAVFDEERSQLWRMTRGDLTGSEEISSISPVFVGNAPGRVLVGLDGTTAVQSGSQVIWPSATGTEPDSVALPQDFEPDFATMAATQAVFVDGDSWFIATSSGGSMISLERPVPVLAMQREADTWPRVGVTTTGGQVFYVDVTDGSVIEVGNGVDAAQTGQLPINHEGCVHTLGGEAGDMDFAVLCDDGRREVAESLNIPVESELRLVNGEVWIDALDGSGFLLNPELELQDVADFSEIFDNTDGDESADGDQIQERLDQSAVDAGLTDADRLDPTLDNVPPVAEDDEAATRLGRSVVIDVLANDSDANGDVILVSSFEVLDGGDIATVTLPTSANSIQVSPTGTLGTVRLRYTVEDGNGGTDTALVEVQILPLTQDENRPPSAVLDRVVAAAGTTVTANLLENDFDPDGDSFFLTSLGESDGVTVLSSHPDGTVQLALPPTVDQGEIELEYVIVDEWQSEQEGVLRITLRLEDSNSPPDARNDAGTTQVGRSITLPLLANDIDPDNDPLSLGIQPRLADGSDVPGFTATTSDGEFLFRPTEPGIFVFEYAATDLTTSDLALIRIEVTEETENRAPIAVRDDVTLALNESRLVRALENDGDPDGDLFSFSDIGVNPSLNVEIVPGVGFIVSMNADADRVEVFDYRISDGDLESAPTQIVVTRSDEQFEDSPPVAVADTVRVRPGRTSRVFVLRNDFDPEGLPLTVVASDSPTEVEASIGGSGGWLNVRPQAEQTLPVSVLYTVADQAEQVAASSVQLVMVRADEPNTPPTARTDIGFTFETQPVTVAVVANDSDPESDGFSVSAISDAPSGGSAVLTEDGTSVVYTPAPGFTGTDEFNYVLSDTEGGTSVGLVRIGVLALPQSNRPPVAADDLAFGPFPADGTVAVFDVLRNDIDPDGDTLTVTEIVTEGSGAVITESGSQIQFQLPDAVDEPTTISFVYRISDGRLGIDDATVQFQIEPIVEPLPPVANPDIAPPVAEGETTTIDVVVNDVDPDGDDSALRIVAVDPSTATFNSRTITITAPAGTTEVAYTIEDADGLQDSSFVTIEVRENLPPVVQAVTLGPFFTDEVIPPIDLSEFVTDPDNTLDELVFAGVSGAVGGTTLLDNSASDNRVVTFQPSPDFDGVGGFAFTVQDPLGNLVSGSVAIELAGPSNRPPQAFDRSLQIEAGIDLSLDVTTLFEDPDLDQTLTYEIESQPGNQLSLTGDLPNLTLEVPVTALEGQTTFSIRATDPEGETAVSTITVTISETQTGPPVAGAVPDQDLNQGESVEFDVLAVAVDTLGTGALQVTSAVLTDPNAGTVSTNGSTIVYQSSETFSGVATIQYVIIDDREGSGGEASGTATAVVVGRPEAPTGVEASTDGPTGAVLTWRVPQDNGGPIEGYRISVNGERIVEHDSTNPTFRFDDLEPGVPVSFQVVAINRAGDSDPSAQSVPVTPDEVPGPPGRPTAAFVPDQPGAIQLEWAASENRGSAIEGYLVEVSVCASGVEEIGNATSFTWTGLPNGRECSFRVTSQNLAGDSLPSTNSGTECAVAVPDAPGQPQVIRGDKEVDVSWAAPNNPDCQSLISYQIVRFRNGVEEARTPVPAGTTSWNSAPLLNGESYSFSVRAENRQGFGDEGPRSEIANPCGVPLQVPAPNAEPGDQFAMVTRTADADPNGCEVTQYLVRVNGESEQPLPVNGVLANLINGQSYTFSVAGVNEVGTGEFSTSSVPVVPFGLPGIPDLASSRGADGERIQETFSGADDNGSPILRYEFSGPATVISQTPDEIVVECINNLGRPCLAVPAAQKVPPTACLQNTQFIEIEGWAVNAAGAGERRVWFHNAGGCPAQPTMNVTAGNGDYTVTWNRPADSTIWVERNGAFGSPVSGTSATFSGTNGTAVAVRVWACNQYGCSSSATSEVTPVAPLGAVTIGLGNNDAGGVCWNAANITAAGGIPNQGCYNVRIVMSGWSAPQTVRCFGTTNNGTWELYSTFTAGNGTHQRCSYSQAGRWVAVVVGGGSIAGDLNQNPIEPAGSVLSNVSNQWPTN